MSNSAGMMAAVAAAAGIGEDKAKDITIDAAFVAANFPAVAAEISKQGADAERSRILGIEAAALPGHEAVIAAHKADGSKSPADAAMAIIAAEKASRGKQLAALDEDEKKVRGLRSEPANGTEPAPKKEAHAGLHGKALWQAEFAGSAELQAEFTSEAAYLAVRAAEDRGAIKVLKNRGDAN